MHTKAIIAEGGCIEKPTFLYEVGESGELNKVQIELVAACIFQQGLNPDPLQWAQGDTPRFVSHVP